MGNQLLIRAYNVGCGDCIYVCIPDPETDGFHILIDCGKKGSDDLLEKAVQHLAGELPQGSAPGKRRLDLIVATHRHEDHIKGFDPAWFKDIEVKNIWLSVGMDPNHPQAEGVNALHSFAGDALQRLVDDGRALSPEFDLLYGVSNAAADRLLMETLPTANGIKPRYVHSGMQHDLSLPAGTEIHILAPEKDVDGYYLGKELEASLRGLQAISGGQLGAAQESSARPSARPANISSTDFRVLQSRMISNGLAFAAKESSIQNNLSVVLLIVWKKRRLLFVGDAEWEGEYREGKHNGSWNVMWKNHRDGHLKDPIDFLKIGHHGSINSTPPPAEGRPQKAPEDGIYAVLDTLLPVPANGAKPAAQAVVSTEREFYDPIPRCQLLVDLARRVSNVSSYGARLAAKGIDPATIWVSTKAKKNKFYETYEKDHLEAPQPMRTDLENVLEGRTFLDIEIPPG